MPEVLLAGFQLAGVGMGTVFSFLTLLVLVTSLMSSILVRWVPEQARLPGDKIDTRRLQAIAIAVQKYRQSHRR
jgi:oxaloacetate decarboxylase gamma subunit